MAGPASGRHIASALSSILADTLTKHKQASAHVDHATKAAFTTGFLESLEQELAPLVTEAFAEFRDDPDVPEHLRVLADEAMRPQNQSSVILQIVMVVGFIMGGISQLAQPMNQVLLNKLWTRFPIVPPSPDALALAVLKGEKSLEEAESLAKQSGVDWPHFDMLVNIAGNPPGPGELLDLYRRGLIDKNRFQHGVRQSHVRDEWFDTYISRFYDPLPVGQAVAAVVQSQIDMSAGINRAVQSGVREEDFRLMYQVHGRPPGPHEIGEMMHRGLISRADAEQAVRESDVKNKYVGVLLDSTQHLPPQDTIRMMVANGAITTEQGVRKLMNIGFGHEDAAALIVEATNRKHAASRNLAQTQILSLYEQNAIDETHATEMLRTLGYDPQEAGWLMMLADTARQHHAHEAAISRIHTLYVGHKIERDTAGTQLDRLHVPPKQRDSLIGLWEIERTSNVAHLTQAQLNRAYQYDFITREEWIRELTRMGFDQWSIGVLDKLYGPAPTT